MTCSGQTEATLDDFSSVDRAFALATTSMRRHAGRSVGRIVVDGKVCFLKRYWLTPSQVFRRHVARGLHELRVIDWLNRHGFAGPRVLARGDSTTCGVMTRLFFLMEDVAGEMPLEQTWWKHPEWADDLLDELATFAARLHDAGFVHTDFSERHIFVGRGGAGWTFRLIDLERARVGEVDDRAAAADLKTLAASIADQKLRERIGGGFLDAYASRRTTLSPSTDLRRLFDLASATRSF